MEIDSKEVSELFGQDMSQVLFIFSKLSKAVFYNFQNLRHCHVRWFITCLSPSINQQKIFKVQICLLYPAQIPMSVIQGRSDAPPYVQANPGNIFARIDNNPNVRNAQYYSPYVPGSKHNNPQFYKSPLTSVEMYRKHKSRPYIANEGPNHIIQETQSKHGLCHDCDWRQLLCWALILLALIALALGLFFLIRALMNKGQGDDHPRRYTPEYVPSPTYTGINPIYVSPVPYSSLQIPTSSGYVMSGNSQTEYTYVTVPSSIPSSTNLRTQQSTTSQKQSVYPTTQPTVNWSPDPTNNYVNPLDVYRLAHN